MPTWNVITSAVGRGAHWLCPRNVAKQAVTFCGHSTGRRQLWTSIQEITTFQNQKFHHHHRWVQLNPIITQQQQNARYWTLSREIQPRGHTYSVFEYLILLRYDIMSNDSHRRCGLAGCLHNQSPRSQLFFLSWRIREVNGFADMKIQLSF